MLGPGRGGPGAKGVEDAWTLESAGKALGGTVGEAGGFGRAVSFQRSSYIQMAQSCTGAGGADGDAI